MCRFYIKIYNAPGCIITPRGIISGTRGELDRLTIELQISIIIRYYICDIKLYIGWGTYIERGINATYTESDWNIKHRSRF